MIAGATVPTPDDDEARRWLAEELARPEYGSELSPLTRFIRWILQALSDAASGGDVDIPIEVFVIVGVSIALLVLLLAVLFNPIRLGDRRKSSAVFDGEDISIEQARERLEESLRSQDAEAVIVWAFRLVVLDLANRGVLRDGPGLTALEAAHHAGRAVPLLAVDLETAAALFDAVRYGDEPATTADVDTMLTLHQRVQAVAPSRSSAKAGAR